MNEKIRRILKEQRKFLGLSAMELAERSGISARTIHKMELGREVSINSLVKVVNGLDLTMIDFWEMVEGRADIDRVEESMEVERLKKLKNDLAGLVKKYGVEVPK